MRVFKALSFCLVALTALAACSKVQETAEAAPVVPQAISANPMEEVTEPTELADQFAYVYGYQVASSLLSTFSDMKGEYLEKGVYDAINSSFLFTEAEANQILLSYQTQYQQQVAAELAATGKKNLEAAESFLKTNALRGGVVSLSDKIQYEVLREGEAEGASPLDDSTVVVQYQLMTLSGELKDSSYERGSASTLSLSNTIDGFREAVKSMKIGEKIRAWIHPDMGYGEYGNGTIGPSQLLIFDIELLSIK